MKSEMIEKYNDDMMLRIDCIHPILLSQDGGASEGLKEMLENIAYSNCKILGKISGYFDEDEDDEEGLMEHLTIAKGLEGYLLAEVSTPVIRVDSDHGSSHSWGYTTQTWVLGKTLDDIVAEGLKHVATMDKRAKEVFEKGPGKKK